MSNEETTFIRKIVDLLATALDVNAYNRLGLRPGDTFTLFRHSHGVLDWSTSDQNWSNINWSDTVLYDVEFWIDKQNNTQYLIEA